MDLDAVDDGDAEVLERAFDLGPRRLRIRGSTAAPGHVDLGRPEDAIGDPESLADVARDLLGGAVAGSGVENRPAAVDQRLHDFFELRHVVAAGHALEGRGTAQADDRQLLAGGGDGPRDHLLARERAQDAGVEGEGRARGGGGADPVASSEHLRIFLVLGL